MKRILAITMALAIVFMGLAPPLQAQIISIGGLTINLNPPSSTIKKKLDLYLVAKLQKGKPSDVVDVIVQTQFPAALEAKLASMNAKLNKKYRVFPGMAIKMPLGFVQFLAGQTWVIKISHDQLVGSASAEDGLEAANSSSGALDALQRTGATGSGVGVAIIDSGIALHPDLTNVVYNMDFTTPGPAVRTDPYGHGTHVAGIVAGSGQSSNGVYAGVAPGARLVNLRVLDAMGHGYTSDVIAAVDWAIANKNMPGNDGQSMNIRVLNMSLGHMPQESAETDPLAVACRRAVQAGIVVVAAAGNNGKNADGITVYGSITSPGTEPSVLTVGAVSTFGTPSRSDDRVATYSSRGPTIDGLLKPDVVAPGSRIVAAMSPGNFLVTSHPAMQYDNNYMKLSGTSMATPVVAGAVAMLLSRTPALTPNAVKSILMYTSEDRGNALDYGVGYINIPGAMDVAAAVNPAAPAGQPWLSTTDLPYSELINGFPAVWSQNIGWGNAVYASNVVRNNDPSFGLGVVWGKTAPSETTGVVATVSSEAAHLTGLAIAWDVAGLTIVWEDALTIVWEDALTIVWEDAMSIVWEAF